MTMRRLRPALMLLAASVLALSNFACRHLDEWQTHDEFAGLRAALDGTDRLDVLIVHGMGHAMDYPGAPLSGYSIGLQSSISQGLGGEAQGAVVGSYSIEHSGVLLGQLAVWRYALGSSGKTIAFYELTWAPALKRAKVALLELDESSEFKEKNPLETQRAPLNSTAKAFVNTHLADPVIYTGAFGRTLRGVAEQAICYMTRALPPASGPCDFTTPARSLPRITVVTHSLGSALVFDALTFLFNSRNKKIPTEQDKGRAAAAQRFAAATTHVYMLANQLPLMEMRVLRAPQNEKWLDRYPCPRLGPAELASETAETGESGGLGAFLDVRRKALLAESGGKPQGPLTFVAFSDPNDLLTYFISARYKTHCDGARFANVTVTNATTEWLMLFADPMAAHTGFQKNARVIRMLVEGGRPEPKP